VFGWNERNKELKALIMTTPFWQNQAGDLLHLHGEFKCVA